MSAMSKARTANEVEQMTETDQSETILDRVCIAMPCNIGWDNMKGNDEVRLCDGCNKNVYNISAMSKKRAEEILSAPQLPCLHIVRGIDGKLVTDECPRWLRPLRKGWTKLVAIAASLMAFFNWQNTAIAEEKKNLQTPSPSARDLNMFQTEPTVIDGKPYSASGPQVGTERWFEDSLLQEWPARISAIGINAKDLPSIDATNLSKFRKIKEIRAEEISDSKLPKHLNRQAWTLFEAARRKHALACMSFLKHKMRECSDTSAEALEAYNLALKHAEQRSHDPGFCYFIINERNKVEDLIQKCTAYFERDKN